jgi:hypothetical protein
MFFESPSSLVSTLSSTEVVQLTALFLDPSSMLVLTRTCTQMYLGLPRNSAMSIQIWRTYLTEGRYLNNKLVLETARALVMSQAVSRSNYKMILAVLVQKNGFMKVSRLRSLLAAGKLSTPVLPHKGEWRKVIRLDQFALKKASKEVWAEPARPSGDSGSRGSTELDFISRIAGRKGRESALREMLSCTLKTLNETKTQSVLTLIFSNVVNDQNFLGLVEVATVASTLTSVDIVSSCLTKVVSNYKTALEETILHSLLRDQSTTVKQKFSMLSKLFEFSCMRDLVNRVNLNHQSALVLVSTCLSKSSDLSGWQEVADLLIKTGADVYLCDRKGKFYEKIGG